MEIIHHSHCWLTFFNVQFIPTRSNLIIYLTNADHITNVAKEFSPFKVFQVSLRTRTHLLSLFFCFYCLLASSLPSSSSNMSPPYQIWVIHWPERHKMISSMKLFWRYLFIKCFSLYLFLTYRQSRCVYTCLSNKSVVHHVGITIDNWKTELITV